MNILIIGSGAREHALAWKLSQSPHAEKIFVAPGNAGSGQTATNVPIAAEDTTVIVAFAREHKIDLVVVGPEAPLAAGLVDALQAASIRAFGPTRAAAEIEASKSFAKAFMQRHNIPTARFASFTEFRPALGYLLEVNEPIVIKASGLAAGKGVILPDCADDAEAALRQIMLDRAFGAAGDEVVIEERLEGEEVSVLAFTDGVTVKPMPPARDHKRLLDGDKGPNTGGMGAYAPVDLSGAQLDEITRTILQPTVDGLRAEGRRFVGVLYAGLMLTRDGPRVLEFNARFGDPEAEVVLPLLDADLLDILNACGDGKLAECEIRWKEGAAACVVVASGGYPGKYGTGVPIHGLDSARARNAMIFHAGTKIHDNNVVTAGGRVLTVTAWDRTMPDALELAYATIAPIRFEGMQFRRDIAAYADRRVSR